MTIRLALVTDIFELSRLWAAMAREADPTMKPNLEMWRNYVVGLMRYEGYFMFVAEDEDRLIGFIDYTMQPEPGKGIWIAVINYFYVLPEVRTSEVSGQLWKSAIESARKNNAKEFSSICFPEKLEFWQRHGFETQFLGIRKEL